MRQEERLIRWRIAEVYLSGLDWRGGVIAVLDIEKRVGAK